MAWHISKILLVVPSPSSQGYLFKFAPPFLPHFLPEQAADTSFSPHFGLWQIRSFCMRLRWSRWRLLEFAYEQQLSSVETVLCSSLSEPAVGAVAVLAFKLVCLLASELVVELSSSFSSMFVFVVTYLSIDAVCLISCGSSVAVECRQLCQLFISKYQCRHLSSELLTSLLKVLFYVFGLKFCDRDLPNFQAF